MRTLAAATVLFAACSVALAQKADGPKLYPPDAATLQRIQDETTRLKAAVADARPKVPMHEADLEVYVKAAEWIVRHQEWFTADSGKQTLAVIEQGFKRAEAAKEGKTPWLDTAGRSVARGYFSFIDGSVQPYGVVYPEGFGKDKSKKWRLDIHLHGRDSSLTEVKFLNQHNGRPAPKDQDYVQLNIYGRGNNAYRWAGEKDIDEALMFFLSSELLRHGANLIDQQRLVLKGFSMGGAGTWHYGLRRPGGFAVLQPGAGFVTTHGYVGKLPDPLPDHQEKCLTIYDGYRYAENAFNVPVVAYSGEKDRQKAAADRIEDELRKLKLADRMTHIVAPGLEHRFPPEWQRTVEASVREKIGEAGSPTYPERIRFVTYTLKHAMCKWVRVRGLERHYDRAVVDATWTGETFRVTTANITRLQLAAPPRTAFPKTITLDGRDVDSGPGGASIRDFARGPEGWNVERDGRAEALTAKRPGVQGPIDDAFTRSFLCVLGTGKPIHSPVHTSAVAQFDRFRREWDKWMRGELPVKKDTEVTDEDLAKKNLILFGDPGSNSLIAKALPKLPITWTAEALVYAGTKYDSATHLPILIQPSPFARNQYVILNSGHTFHEADFKGTNALLYPRLGDYAVVKPAPTATDPAAFEVVTAGLFDEEWKFPRK